MDYANIERMRGQLRSMGNSLTGALRSSQLTQNTIAGRNGLQPVLQNGLAYRKFSPVDLSPVATPRWRANRYKAKTAIANAVARP